MEAAEIKYQSRSSRCYGVFAIFSASRDDRYSQSAQHDIQPTTWHLHFALDALRTRAPQSLVFRACLKLVAIVERVPRGGESA